MNYIKQLQANAKEQSAINEALDAELIVFSQHLMSSKFYTDTTIQVADVQRFIDRLFNIKAGI